MIRYETLGGAAVPWCWLIVILPWLYGAELWFHRPQASSTDLFIFLHDLHTPKRHRSGRN